ncbi:phage tail protein [Horticoccus sp. 23ND18S-11]|uniref:phage tail protein n=1 Tax=Horticoccus sp. 23ND18S-11 TaxID=3391832 RepID=UPI0039C8FC61
MDANGQRFWLALGGAPWTSTAPGTLELLPDHLRLASQAGGDPFVENVALATAQLARVPMTRDAFGTWAFVDADGVTVRATGAFSEPEATASSPVLLVAPAPVTDLALGADGFLTVVAGGVLIRHPLSSRFAAATLAAVSFSAFRFAPDPTGGGWALDRTRRRLARLSGQAWPTRLAFSEPPPTAFLPVQENPTPPELKVMPDGWLAPGEDPVALACSPEGRLAVLFWTNTQPRVRLVDASGRLGPAATLPQLERPTSLAWLSNDRFAVIAPGVSEAVVYTWREGNLMAAGDVYPLRDHDGGPFLHGTTATVEYPSRRPTPAFPQRIAPRPLVSIALPALAQQAEGRLATPFDSGEAGTAWHRLYVEAQIPPGTGFTLLAAATDSNLPADAPTVDDWQPHHFGAIEAAHRHEPRAAWVPSASEIPGHAGFAADAPVRDRNGLFTVLLQRANCPVRTLRGRFLHLRIVLRGNLRATPCLHAVRAYGPRFSYQDKYLPALYRETLFGPEADVHAPGGASTRADFLGRMLANFEGVLTPLEDKVAHSWLLTDPQHTPDEALAWLGSWIGVDLAPWYPAQHRRRHLQHAPELFRRRGTFQGLQLALDLATGNGVRAGRIVVVEDYWFRRTLQTVLGVKLDRDHDPLLGGSFISGNSKVGDTLFLSEEGMEKKFLALFDASFRLRSADRATVDTFFASLAHRVTVIVHETATPEELALVERIAAAEAPAHVITRVRPASADFMVGLTALLSVDTYLRPHPLPAAVEVQATILGDGSLLQRPPSLDPRLEGRSS